MKSAALLSLLGEVRSAIDRWEKAIRSMAEERDDFAVFLFQARHQYRHASLVAGKSGREVEYAVRTSYQRACKFGFPGDIRTWQALLQVNTRERPQTAFESALEE